MTTPESILTWLPIEIFSRPMMVQSLAIRTFSPTLLNPKVRSSVSA